MAVKYLAGDRIIGTAAERAALTVVTNPTSYVNTGNLGSSYNLENKGYTIAHQQTTASAHSAIRTGDKEEFGMRCASGSVLNGVTPTGIVLVLKKVGSPTGNCYVKIYKEEISGSETAVYTSPALDVSTITTSDEEYIFDLGGSTTIGNDYKIIFNYVGGSSGNDIRIKYDPNQSFDGTTTGLTIRNSASSGTFDTAHNDGYEMKFKLLTAGTDVSFGDSSKTGFGQVVKFPSNATSNDPPKMLLEKKFTNQSMIGGDDYSFGCWAKLTDNNGDQEMCSIGSSQKGVYNYLKLYHWSANKFRSIIYIDSSSNNNMESTNDDANDGEWHHFMIERNGATNTFYIDNVSQATWSSSNSFANMDMFRVGRWWEGEIDEVFFLRRDTTSAEKTAMQSGKISGISSMFTDSLLKFYFDFDGSTTYPNLTNGTIFEESDTGKHYMFDGTSTWNEMT